MQWMELHGSELVWLSVEWAIETIQAVEFKVVVSGFPRPGDFPPPSGDRVHLHVDENQVVEAEAQQGTARGSALTIAAG